MKFGKFSMNAFQIYGNVLWVVIVIYLGKVGSGFRIVMQNSSRRICP